MSKILTAARLAVAAHGEQRRKFTNEPYVHHPARVAGRIGLLPWATEDMVAAAYLHDTLEDTRLTYVTIMTEVGPEVARLVQDLTDEYTKEKCPSMNRRARKAAEAERLGTVSRAAKAIKLADIADNLAGCPPGDSFTSLFLEEKEALLLHLRDADESLVADVQLIAARLRAEAV